MIKLSYKCLFIFQFLLLTACSEDRSLRENNDNFTSSSKDSVESSLPQKLDDNKDTFSEQSNVLKDKIEVPTISNLLDSISDSQLSSDSIQESDLSRNSVIVTDKRLMILIIVLLSFIIIVSFFVYKINDDLFQLKDSHSNALVQLDKKLNELIRNYTQISSKVSQSIDSDDKSDSPRSNEEHKMYVQMAHHVYKSRKNISDLNTKDPKLKENSENKKLIRLNDKMMEELESKGYEIIDLTNKDFNTGLNVKVINFVSDESLPPGKRTITKVIKPNIKYKGKVISQGDVEVTENPNDADSSKSKNK